MSTLRAMRRAHEKNKRTFKKAGRKKGWLQCRQRSAASVKQTSRDSGMTLAAAASLFGSLMRDALGKEKKA
jgi:hypothetical protein